MDRYQLQEFLESWIIVIVMFIGIFLIAVPPKALLTGVVMYGIGIHLCVIIMLCGVFDSEFYEGIIVKIMADNKKGSKAVILAKRAFTVGSFILFGVILSYKGRWYLLVVTLVVLVLFIIVQKIIVDDIKRRKANEVHESKL